MADIRIKKLESIKSRISLTCREFEKQGIITVMPDGMRWTYRKEDEDLEEIWRTLRFDIYEQISRAIIKRNKQSNEQERNNKRT